MKLMKIFGMVFALHVALICILFSIQGCRSTPAPRATEAAAPASEPATVEPVSENWTNTPSSALQPSAVDTSSSNASTAPMNAPPLSGLSPAERARLSPTRPDNPGAYISTGTPSAIAPPPPEPSTYVVRSGDSFWKIARAHNTTTAEIQRLNPGIRADALRPGMTLKIPGTVRQGGTTAPSNPLAGVSSTAATATYIVRSGDSLSKIAARNGTTVSALRELNSLRSDLLQIGQELKIPAAPAGAPNAMGATSPLPPAGAASSGDQVTIKVQRGDTLGEIARKFDVTVADLMSANNITDPTRIRVGQTLVIPGFQAVGSGAIPRAEPPRSSTPTTTTTTTPAQTPPPLPVESPMEVDAPPVIPTSPAPERPPEFDAPAADEEAPPVQPLDEPMPAP